MTAYYPKFLALESLSFESFANPRLRLSCMARTPQQALFKFYWRFFLLYVWIYTHWILHTGIVRIV